MDPLRIVEIVITIITFVATAISTIWIVSAKLARHDEKQKARNELQDVWTKNHESVDAKAHTGLVELMNQVQESTSKQFVRATNDIQRLQLRGYEMSDQINKVNVLTDEDRKRADDDRKALSLRLSGLADQFHEMDKKLTQVHTIVTSEKQPRRRNGHT